MSAPFPPPPPQYGGGTPQPQPQPQQQQGNGRPDWRNVLGKFGTALQMLGNVAQPAYVAGRGNPAQAQAMWQRQQAQQRQQKMAAELAQIAPNGPTPQNLQQIAQIAMKYGNNQMAMQMMNMVQTGQLERYRQRARIEERNRAERRKPPTTRTVWDGQRRDQQEWQPATGTWKEVGSGVATPLVEMNTGPAGKEDAYGRYAERYGDPDIARQLVSGDAFIEDLTGMPFVASKGPEREKIRGAVETMTAINELERSAVQVGDKYGATGATTPFTQWFQEATTGRMDPSIVGYNRRMRTAALAYQKATTGAQANEKELAIILSTFPQIQALIQADGSIHPAALELLDGWRLDMKIAYINRLPASQREAGEAAWNRRFDGRPSGGSSSGARGGSGGVPAYTENPDGSLSITE